MREIKFRARVKENGKLFLFYQNNQYLNSFLRRVTSFLAYSHDGEDGRHEAYLEDHALEKCLDQYTGLKDVKGKEIYEGDVVRLHDEIFSVVYEAPTFWCADKDGVNDSMYDSPIYEVIGNVWENPNLITPK